MNWIVLIRIFIPAFTLIIVLLILKTHILTFKHRSSKNVWLNFSLSMGLLAVSLIPYSLIPLIKEEDKFLAELFYGANTILTMIALFLYTQYLHAIYKKIPWFSDLFYASAGGAFILLLYNPWELKYHTNFGYSQTLSLEFLIIFLIEDLCLLIILGQFLYNIRKKIDEKLMVINITLLDESNTDRELKIISNRKQNLLEKKKNMNLIVYFFLFGLTIGLIGFLPILIPLDTIGILIAFIPQTYFFSKDDEYLLLFLSQKLEEDAKSLQRNFQLLHQSTETSSYSQPNEIKRFIEFIEKIDNVFYKKI